MQAIKENAETGATEETLQFLTFVLDSEEYAIDILQVQEIKSWSPVTRVPKSPAYLLGVINLRGSIVPIINLRQRFGLADSQFTSKTAVVIVRTEHEGQEKIMGLVVDRVSEVYHFTSSQIQSSSSMAGSVNSEFIAGLAKAEKQLVILLNLDRIVDSNLLESAQEVVGGSPDAEVTQENAANE